MWIRQLDSVAQAVNFVQLALQSKPNSRKENVLVTDKQLKFQSPNSCPPFNAFVGLGATDSTEGSQSLPASEAKAHTEAFSTIYKRCDWMALSCCQHLRKRPKNFPFHSAHWPTFCSQLIELAVTFNKGVEKTTWKQAFIQIWEDISNIYHHQWQNLHKMIDFYFAVFNMKWPLSRA